MFGQQNKLKVLFGEHGWELIETRAPHTDDWWIADIWLIKSLWSPTDCYVTLRFIVDKQLEDRTKRNYEVLDVEASLNYSNHLPDDIFDYNFSGSHRVGISIKRKWEKRIPEFFESLPKLRLIF